MLNFKELKNELLDCLHEKGIPEFKLTIKDYKNNPKGNLGCYRSLSQFRSSPIICLDISAHEKALQELNTFSEDNLHATILETLCHEYGHVIEEYIRQECAQDGIMKALDEFKDMEDFAESFAQWMNHSMMLTVQCQENIQKIVSHYVGKVFLEESINWVKQPKWKRALDYYWENNKKSYAMYETMDGAFNHCRQASEALAARLCDICSVDIKVLRLEGFSGSLEHAHAKWQKLGNASVVHYVVLLENEYVLDLTAKQFNENNPPRQLKLYQEVESEWNKLEVLQDYTKQVRGFCLK